MSKYTNAIRTLAKMRAIDADNAERLLNAHVEEQDGGAGSGNFGHAGRPGKRGGSAPGGGRGGTKASNPSGVSSLHKSVMNLARLEGGKKKATSQRSDPRYSKLKPSRQTGTIYPPGKAPAEQKQKSNSRKTIEFGGKTYTFDPNIFSKRISSYGYEPERSQFPESNTAVKGREAVESQRKGGIDWLKKTRNQFSDPRDLEKFDKTQKELEAGFGFKRPTPEESRELTEKMRSTMSTKINPEIQKKYLTALEKEPEITNDMCDIAEKFGHGFVGFAKRIKSAADKDGTNRLQVKFDGYKNKDARKGKILTDEEAAGKLKDLIRYTMVVSHDTMGDDAEKVLRELEKKGYEVIKAESTWDSFDENNSYRGLNCAFRKGDGPIVELQFHSPVSYSRKGAMHYQYEIDRDTSNKFTPEQKAQARKRMYDIYGAMPMPKGLDKIKARAAKLG